MTFSGSKAFSRLALPLAAGVLGAGISLASTLPRPISDQPAGETADAASSTLLPKMMDASAFYADTGDTTPIIATERETGAGPQSSSTSLPALHASVASEELSDAPVASFKPAALQAPVPEPVSVILMASGLLGLIGARRFRGSSRQRHDL